MIAPELPENEPQRLASLRSLGIVYTPADERFDRITRITTQVLSAPIALVSLVDERVQWFKSSQGLDASETPRELSFCGHAILEQGTFVVEDATKDERFRENPLVTGRPDIRFYAGHPVHTADGMPVGTLCIIGREPRAFGDLERNTLRDLAALVDAELQREQLNYSQRTWLAEKDELVKKASIDALTRTWNRGAIMDLLDGEIARAKRDVPLSVAMIDVDKFKNVNDTYGHQSGDLVLADVASRIRASVRDFDQFGRYGGEEFLVVLSNCSETEARTACERIRARVAAAPIATTDETPVAVTISIGIATYGADRTNAAALIGVADAALYRAKEKGRNRVESGLTG
jgi:diguanylate cyclase (GGDEF)-like protein